MRLFWAQIRLLLARVITLVTPLLTCSDTDEIGLPNQGLQIYFDNLTKRGHGYTVVSIDVTTRPRLRTRMTAETNTCPLCRGFMQHAHTNNWIERDTPRIGDHSVGRCGADPRGRRMRRDCPNDRRRPTRSASDGCPSRRLGGGRPGRLRTR